MNLKSLLFFTILCCCYPTIKAQETIKNIDSVLQLLQNAPRDTATTILYQKVAGHYNVTHLDSAKTFAMEGIRLSEELNFPKGKWINLNTLGNYHERKTEYDEAMDAYNKALEIVESLNSTKGYAVVLNNIATVHIRRGNYDEALKFLFDALKAEEELGNRNGVAQAYNNIGVVYYYLQDFDKTTKYLTDALVIQEELGNYSGLQNGYNNVGAIYDYQQKYDDAIASYNKAYEISLKIGDKKEQASNLSNIGLAYSKKKDYVNSDTFFTRSINLRREIKDYNGMAHSYANYGEALRTQRQFNKAEEYLQQALEISEKHSLKLPAKETYSSLSELARDRNDHRLANEYLYKYIAVKDSILNENNVRIIAETEAKYETEKKEKEILQQRAELAEKELQVKQKNAMIYGGFGLALILGLLGYLLYNQQKLKNRQLKKENELKTALAKIETQNRLQEQRLRISRDLHDNIGAQLTFIISSLDNLKFGFKDMNEKLGDRLSGISSFTGQTIYELRDTIWAMNKNNISVEDLQARITNFIEKAKQFTEKTNFAFNVSPEIDPDHTFSSVKGMNMYRIIQEAVNNALKYSEADKIEVNFEKLDSTFEITVSDNGKGFNSESVTDGNGLSNMKKRARDIDGQLEIRSSASEGTLLTLSIPK
jgi:signal transduction histidine kinase